MTNKEKTSKKGTQPKELNNQDSDEIIIDWSIDENGNMSKKPRRKRTLKDLRGVIKLDHETDSVQLKKELYYYD